MSKKEKDLFVLVYNYAVDYIEIIDDYYPNNEYTFSVLFVTAIILEIVANSSISVLEEEKTIDQIYTIIEERIINNKNNIRDRYKDIISSLSDDLIELLAEYTDEDQMSIIIDSWLLLKEKDPTVFDNTDYNIVITKIEPYIIKVLNPNSNENLNLTE
jgi:hypothetical protein